MQLLPPAIEFKQGSVSQLQDGAVNEYILIYQVPAHNESRTSIDQFFQEHNLNFRRMNDQWPHVVRIDSERPAEEITTELRSNPLNSGAILFSVDQTVHV